MKKNFGMLFGFWGVFGFILAFLLLTSCVSKEEKLYGKIDAKTKDERALIQKIQNTVFYDVNANLTLKEAIASNAFSKNIVWRLFPAEKKGAYFVTFEYYIDPIKRALMTDFFDDEILNKAIKGGNFSRYSLPDWYVDMGKDPILSPYAYANMFTRFIATEYIIPHHQNSAKEIQEVIIAYEKYQEDNGYSDQLVFIPAHQVPDQLPEPFFNVTAAKFIGTCYSELSSNDVNFVEFTLLFDFTLPYLNNKEYKGYGMTISEDQWRVFSDYGIDRLKPEDGLFFIYEDKKIYELYPYVLHPVSLTDFKIE